MGPPDSGGPGPGSPGAAAGTRPRSGPVGAPPRRRTPAWARGGPRRTAGAVDTLGGMSPRRTAARTLAALLGGLAAGAALAGCAGGAGDGADATTTIEYLAVDPGDFRVGDYLVIGHRVGGETGTCLIGELGVSCTGTPAAGIPDVEIPPFPAKRPGAVSISDEGVDYGLFEGVPPAPADLGVHESVTADGATCELPDGDTLICTRGGESFTIAGADHAISTGGEPVGRYFTE